MKVLPRRRPTGTQIRAARLLVRRRVQAALSTTVADGPTGAGAGAPYGSLVTVATDPRGAPLLLLSDLSDHTRNLKADDRAALLFTEAGGHVNPQEDARITLMGRLAPDPDPAARARFLARHPYAALYAGFADFAVYRMTVAQAHVVGGFGAAGWIDDPADFLVPAALADAVAAQAAALCDAANAANAANAADGAALDALAVRAGGAAVSGWRAVALDADGVDLAPPPLADGTPPEAGRVRRVAFPAPVADADGVAAALRALLHDDPAPAPPGGRAPPSYGKLEPG